MSVIALLFLLLAVVMVISTLWPGWNFANPPVFTPPRIIGLIIGLILLYILYVIVASLFGVGISLHASASPFAAGALMVGLLDTNTKPEHDPIAPKPVWESKTFWVGVVLTVLGLSTYFSDPAHTPALTVASISEAVGGVAAIVLRIWFTTGPIAGTPAAAEVETALIQKTATG